MKGSSSSSSSNSSSDILPKSTEPGLNQQNTSKNGDTDTDSGHLVNELAEMVNDMDGEDGTMDISTDASVTASPSSSSSPSVDTIKTALIKTLEGLLKVYLRSLALDRWRVLYPNVSPRR